MRFPPLNSVLLSLAAGAALMLSAGCAGDSTAPRISTPSAQQAWHVTAGSSASSEAVQALDFFPAALSVDAGDTVTWTFPAGEVHTVSLLGAGQTKPPGATDPTVGNPAGGSTYDGSTFTSSGFLAGGKTYSLTFTTPGTYRVYCLIHGPEMTQVITVQAAGTAYPQSQAAYDAQAQAAIAAELAKGQQIAGIFPFTSGGPHLAAGLSPGYAAGPSGAPDTVTLLRFSDGTDATQSAVTIATGTTLTWTNLTNNEVHDVVIPPAGQSVPPTLSPFAPATTATTYDGTALVESPVLFPGQSFTMTFTKAGTYTYRCLFHDDVGMIGTVIVN